MNKDEIKTAMDKQRTDLENWAKDNGIDVKYLMGGRGKFGGRMRLNK
jgi:DNA invertase Pin-like site-specific DNA recombinase